MIELAKQKKIEFFILILLWISLLSTAIYGMITDYELGLQGWFGLGGLIAVTLYLLVRPQRATDALLVLLFLGTFNLVSFTFVYNFYFSFNSSIGVNVPSSPSIDLIIPDLHPFVLLILLGFMIIRRKRVKEIWFFMVTKSKTEIQEEKESIKSRFKKKFEQLSDAELEHRSQQQLDPEVKEALMEVISSRKI